MKGSNLQLDLFSELTQCIKKTESRHKRVTEQRTKDRNKLLRRLSGEIDHQKEWKREYAGLFPPLPQHKTSNEAETLTNHSAEDYEFQQGKSKLKSQSRIAKSDINSWKEEADAHGHEGAVGGVTRTNRRLNKNKMLTKLPQISKDCSALDSKSRDRRDKVNQSTSAKESGGQRHSAPSNIVAMRSMQRSNAAGCSDAIKLMSPLKAPVQISGALEATASLPQEKKCHNKIEELDSTGEVRLDPYTKALLDKAERMSTKCKELESMQIAARYGPSLLTPVAPSFQSVLTKNQQPNAPSTVNGGNAAARVIRRSTSKINADNAKCNEVHSSQTQADKKSQRLNRQITRQLSRQASLESSPAPTYVKLDPNMQADSGVSKSLKPSSGSTFDLFDQEAGAKAYM
eukprot:CAMPEP_0114434656 /NCGR_PEP_ID=MMETSP0103-20121206/12384_1 /TAXON_ID=37642 ORGANISM="Paraphysomonas imperforata, Strain PA2" /NCGR_SAMPLE_ID=MMETSP0103 /ASSEMBLY_ACC=CAM_ASM_000201 /LENGTH=400 /DNA_ID=CAMNT_0001604571 /DNA_START=113 /DNA_END=1314 /DNA_ORIENTATION=-